MTIATGEAIEIFNDTKVGFPVTYGFGVRPLTWFDDDTVIFPCEISLWLHVCSAPSYGSIFLVKSYCKGWIPAKELVVGECEVQDYIPFQGYVYVSHNCDLIDTLSISQVRLSYFYN